MAEEVSVGMKNSRTSNSPNYRNPLCNFTENKPPLNQSI